MHVSLGRRLQTALLLCAWLLPGAVGLMGALHLELHHDAHDSPSERALAFALAAEHGHSHELTEPAHGHPATRIDFGAAASDPATAAAGPWGLPAEPLAAAVQPAPSPPLRPPPKPLVTLHCALLT